MATSEVSSFSLAPVSSVFLLGGNDAHFKAKCFLGFLVFCMYGCLCGLGECRTNCKDPSLCLFVAFRGSRKGMSCCNVTGCQHPTIGFSWMLLLLGVETLRIQVVLLLGFCLSITIFNWQALKFTHLSPTSNRGFSKVHQDGSLAIIALLTFPRQVPINI